MLPGEGLNEVPGEAQDPRELRTVGGLNEVRREAHVPRELRAIEEETGGGLNKVLREACDHRELRAVHSAQQVLVCPKDSSVARGVIITRVPTSTCQYPSHNPLLPGEHRDGS